VAYSLGLPVSLLLWYLTRYC